MGEREEEQAPILEFFLLIYGKQEINCFSKTKQDYFPPSILSSISNITEKLLKANKIVIIRPKNKQNNQQQ